MMIKKTTTPLVGCMFCDGHWTDSISVLSPSEGAKLLLPAHCAFTEEERGMRFFVVVLALAAPTP
jgi:hypothetical protein